MLQTNAFATKELLISVQIYEESALCTVVFNNKINSDQGPLF